MRTGNVVLIRNAVETLGYFSGQIGRELERMGAKLYWIDYDRMYESLDGLSCFAGGNETVLLTFNFIGIGGEDIFLSGKEEERGERPGVSEPESVMPGQAKAGRTVWERCGMRCVNILVDHPMYFHKKLLCAPEDMLLFCIDREHVRYVRRFYPDIRTEFLATAGNLPKEEMWAGGAGSGVPEPVPFEQRGYDLVFTANYVSFDDLTARLGRQGPEYEAFYRGILDDLTARPGQSVDAVMERHITEELGERPDRERREAMAGMAAIDLCARAFYREAVLNALAEADIRVHVFGADWERMPCREPHNLILNGRQVDSAACVQAVRSAKISLNVMPWFQDGAHDRVFTAMLQGTAALTDASRYLREEFADGEEIVFYPLTRLSELTDQTKRLLSDQDRLAQIAQRGYQKAKIRHTWAARVRETLSHIVF